MIAKLTCFWQSERAARKATILQMATMYTVIGGTLLNLGMTLSSQGSQVFANGSFVGAGDKLTLLETFKLHLISRRVQVPNDNVFVLYAGVFLALFARSMQRVKKLDKFEKMI